MYVLRKETYTNNVYIHWLLLKVPQLMHTSLNSHNILNMIIFNLLIYKKNLFFKY